MGLRIHTNVASMSARRSLHAATLGLEGGYRRLASGLRIAVAADDAAGLGISETMRARIRSLRMVARGIEDGIGLARTAEGALQEVSNVLGRMRELLVRGESGTLSAEDRAVMDEEVQALKQELDRVSGTTSFNGIALLDGVLPGVRIQVSVDDSGSVIPIQLIDASVAGLGLDSVGVGSAPPGFDSIAAVDTAITIVSDGRSLLGAADNRLSSCLHSTLQSREALSVAESRIRDADVADEMARLTRERIVQEAAGEVLGRANAQPELALELLVP